MLLLWLSQILAKKKSEVVCELLEPDKTGCSTAFVCLVGLVLCPFPFLMEYFMLWPITGWKMSSLLRSGCGLV